MTNWTAERIAALHDLTDLGSVGLHNDFMHNPVPLQQELMARDRGISLAAESRAHVVARARYHAKNLALKNGTVDADQVNAALVEEGIPCGALGNAAGIIFRGKQWECIGTTQSTRKGRHGSLIRIWRLK